MHITHIKLLQRSTLKAPSLRACALVAALAGFAAPALAVPTGCALTTAASGAVFDKAFPTLSRDAMPSTVSAGAPIVAKCTSANGEAGSYRWTLTRRALTFTRLSGATPPAVVEMVGRRFNMSSATLEVSEGMGSTAQSQATVNTTGQLWYLSDKLSAGQYRLSQLFDVSEEYCKRTGNHLTCKSQGPVRQYRADYTLTVVDPPPEPAPPPTTPTQPTEPPPGTGAGAAPSPGRGVKPSPWTVPGYAAKRRCEKCDELRTGG